tara:strand:+ start:2953 stop:3123 length:171 start_codon:yes stop_codon:yes gene_type:complete
MNDKSISDYLTIKEVVRKLKVSRPTLYAWNNSNKLIMRKIGGKVVYKKSDLENFLP